VQRAIIFVSIINFDHKNKIAFKLSHGRNIKNFLCFTLVIILEELFLAMNKSDIRHIRKPMAWLQIKSWGKFFN
jgi:hypothetical protein